MSFSPSQTARINHPQSLSVHGQKLQHVPIEPRPPLPFCLNSASNFVVLPGGITSDPIEEGEIWRTPENAPMRPVLAFPPGMQNIAAPIANKSGQEWKSFACVDTPIAAAT
jgi:hypothetical protein